LDSSLYVTLSNNIAAVLTNVVLQLVRTVKSRANIRNLWHMPLSLLLSRRTTLGLRPSCRLSNLQIELEASWPAMSGLWSWFGYHVVGVHCSSRLVLSFCAPSFFVNFGRGTAQTSSATRLDLYQTSQRRVGLCFGPVTRHIQSPNDVRNHALYSYTIFF